MSSPQAELQAELREQLLGPMQPGAQAHAAGLSLGPATAADQNIDPAIAGAMMPVGGSVHVNGAQSEEPPLRAEAKRSSKRELSSSKRAAQNRAAQVKSPHPPSPLPLSSAFSLSIAFCDFFVSRFFVE
jgi:hypothetical protein